jgi:hypothetical protein
MVFVIMPEIIVMGRYSLLLLCLLVPDIDKRWHVSVSDLSRPMPSGLENIWRKAATWVILFICSQVTSLICYHGQFFF